MLWHCLVPFSFLGTLFCLEHQETTGACTALLDQLSQQHHRQRACQVGSQLLCCAPGTCAWAWVSYVCSVSAALVLWGLRLPDGQPFSCARCPVQDRCPLSIASAHPGAAGDRVASCHLCLVRLLAAAGAGAAAAGGLEAVLCLACLATAADMATCGGPCRRHAARAGG